MNSAVPGESGLFLYTREVWIDKLEMCFHGNISLNTLNKLINAITLI